jgi:hypothetical protein
MLALQYAPIETSITNLAINVGIPYVGMPYTAAIRHDNLVCDVAQ